MHVLIVQPTANSTTFGWEDGFEQLGHDVTVLTASDKRQFGGRPGARIHAVPDMAWSHTLARRSGAYHRLVDVVPHPARVRSELRALAPDVALVKVDKARNAIIGRVLTSLGVPWVLWQEQLPPLSRRWRAFARTGVRPAATFTALDARPGGVALAQVGSAMARISYTPHPVTPPSTAEARDGAVTRILVVASFKNHTVKRPWFVLEAAAERGLLDGRAAFTFAGQGSSAHVGHQRLEELTARLGIERLVELRPNVPFEDMGALYAAHDVLVLPSVREQFGMAIVEAMAHGLPTIVSDVVGAIGCVVPEGTGLIFPVDDRAALGEAMARLVTDAQLRATLGEGARRFVADHLDGRDAAQRILRLAGQD